MQPSISGHHIDVTQSLKEYVFTKFDKLQRHSDTITSSNVILSVDKQVQKAEAKIHVNGAELFADAEHEDLYAAIDVLTDRLDRQLIKHKEKQRNRGRSSIIR